MENQTIESLKEQVAKLQTALDEAYDIIDELEFELESVSYKKHIHFDTSLVFNMISICYRWISLKWKINACKTSWKLTKKKNLN